MASYFSFRKFITTPFVKVVYFLGFIALTVAGITLAVWAGLRLHWATMATQQGVYYIAIGVGAVIIGNIAWRIICEFWVVLFSIHDRLVSIDRGVSYGAVQHDTEPELIRGEVEQDKIQRETKSEIEQPRQSPYAATRPASVLGLS